METTTSATIESPAKPVVRIRAVFALVGVAVRIARVILEALRTPLTDRDRQHGPK